MSIDFDGIENNNMLCGRCNTLGLDGVMLMIENSHERR